MNEKTTRGPRGKYRAFHQRRENRTPDMKPRPCLGTHGPPHMYAKSTTGNRVCPRCTAAQRAAEKSSAYDDNERGPSRNRP